MTGSAPFVRSADTTEEISKAQAEENRERILQGERVGRGLVAEIRLADDHAREECPERERDVEERRGAHRDAPRVHVGQVAVVVTDEDLQGCVRKC